MNNNNYYLLIKKKGYDPVGKPLTARESATLLMENEVWSLWEHTHDRKRIEAEDR